MATKQIFIALVEVMAVAIATILIDRWLSTKVAVITLCVLLIILGYHHYKELKIIYEEFVLWGSVNKFSAIFICGVAGFLTFGGLSYYLIGLKETPKPTATIPEEAPPPLPISPSIKFEPDATLRPPVLKPAMWPDTLTLRWLFKNELPQLWIQTNEMVVTDSTGTRKIESQIYMDFPGRSRFVGFYIHPDGHPYDDCIALPEVIDPLIAHFRENYRINAGTFGASQTKFDDLSWTGRVYIYHDDSLDLQERAKIELLFKTKGWGVIFRGPDWLMFQLQVMREQRESSGKSTKLGNH